MAVCRAPVLPVIETFFSQWNGKGVREKYMNEKREENYSLAVHCMLLFMLSFLTS